jgi:glycosyltransferase involved in cell wall biosynthesis
MLRALAKVCTVEPGVLYLIAGEGDSYWRGEGGLRGQLEQEAATLGIKENVRLLGYYPDLKTILHATDLLVSPSLLEGMQVSLIEAMAAGRPIVATAIGGTPDAVVDGQTGLLVPPADASALTSAVLCLLGDRDRLFRMGAAGRRRAEERFDVQIVADQILRVCGEVTALA